MVVKEDLTSLDVEPSSPAPRGCVQDGTSSAGHAPFEGSEFSPRIRRILEAQPLSPLSRATLTGPTPPEASYAGKTPLVA